MVTMTRRWPILLLLTVWGSLSLATADWTDCPTPCRCKWVSGKKAADCSNSSLSAVPDGLSPEIQILDLSGNVLQELPDSTFRHVGLINIHKVLLKSCGIRELHKEAFHGLAIVIEIDLSYNDIHALHPGTFRDNVALRLLNLNGNPIQKLENGLFSDLTNLQSVYLSGCQLTYIARKTFVNVPRLKTLHLDGNNLTTMKVETLESLYSLGGLTLHDNPWHCDCHLKDFWDWTIERHLYAQPTACAAPPKLKGKLWTELDSDDLACKPQILSPPEQSVVEVDGGNVTLACQVVGNPRPVVQWVLNSTPLSNDTQRLYRDRNYVVSEGNATSRWVNLTLVNVGREDAGTYMCVARNAGGMEERNVVLNVQDSSTGIDVVVTVGSDAGVNLSEAWPLMIGLVCGLAILLAVIIILCICCCRRKRRRQKKAAESVNGDALSMGGSTDQEKSLLTKVNPVQKPPRRLERPSVNSSGTELTDMKSNLLDNGSVFLGDDRYEERSLDSMDRHSAVPQHGISRSRDALDEDAPGNLPPDLLSFSHQVSPAGSTASTAPDNTRLPAQHGPQSPPFLHPTSTLPYSRSASPFAPVVLPRQGYVTIPRRPRVPSWSSAPTPDPLFKFEPVYDNLGPRTTADGSSVLSLNKSDLMSPSIRNRPLPSTPSAYPSGTSTLPPYYAPIEELDAQSSPALSRANRRSIPNTDTAAMLPARHRDSWAARIAPDGASVKRRDEAVSPVAQKNSENPSSVRHSPHSATPTSPKEVKVPPKPPPKPKKKPVEPGPLYEDEGEDGTEV